MEGHDMIKGDIAKHAEQLLADREPFVHATVVRASRPTSVRPGDSAIVRADGTIEGFVGGACAQESVRLYAARALETDEALLLRLVPGAEGEDASESDEPAGVVVAHNPCLSGGSLEIFLDPQLPAPRVLIGGDTPIARALEEVARAAGYAVQRGAPGDTEPGPQDAAVIVASHGNDEEGALVRALEAGVGYVGLVASAKRGAEVCASLDVPDALRGRIHTPAGLDIGARKPADVAIAILAELVGERTTTPPAPVRTATAVDPVCGMEIVASDATLHLDVGGERVYFCCEGCRATYAEQHAEDVRAR
jgi:xanthine dehydrogenase accessory factor